MLSIVIICLYIAAALSILGSLLMLLSYFMFSNLRKPSGILSAWVASGNFVHALFSILQGPNGSFECTLSAFGRSYGSLISLFVSVIITNVVHKITLSSIQLRIAVLVEISYFHYFVTWILSLILAVLPFFTNSYGKDSNDAWYVNAC